MTANEMIKEAHTLYVSLCVRGHEPAFDDLFGSARVLLPAMAVALEASEKAVRDLDNTNARLQERNRALEVEIGEAHGVLTDDGVNHSDRLSQRIRDLIDADRSVLEDEEAAHQETLDLLAAEKKAHEATKKALADLRAAKGEQ